MKKTAFYLLALTVFLLMGGKMFGQASVTTDQSDYAPDSTATITGSGFTPGETVQLQVANLTDTNYDTEYPEYQPWQVVADTNGNFTTTWYVTEDEANTTLQLTATGLTSGLVAQEIFTDASYNITSISIGNQNGSLNYGTSGSSTYTITNFFSGNGNSVGAVTNLVAAGLPTGATASFSLVPTTGPGSGAATGVNGAFTNMLTITSATTTPAGIYTITVVGNDNKGGHATNTTTFTVNKANSTISQSGTNFTYNATGQTPTLSISGSTGARTTNYVGTSVSYTSINPPTNAGSYYVSNTVAADSNYNGATNSLAFTISKAGLTLTPGTNVKAYDGTTSATNVPSASGLQGSDTVSGTTVVYNTATAGTGKTLSITAYTVNDNNSGNNYTVTANTSTGGTINKANSTISQSGTNFTYNATGQTPTLSISGSTGARTTNYVGTSVSYTSINPPTNAGSYYVSNTVAADSNYNGATNSLAFTISKAGLTLTPGTNVKAYDGTTSATNVPSASGLQGSDTVSGTTVVYNTATAGTGKTLSITAYTVNDNNSGNNYTVTANTSTGGTINKANSTISQSGTNFTYNATGQTPTLSISGSTGARTTNYVGTSVSYTSINPPTNAGSYYVSNTVAADSNYNGATNSLAFTISKAGLTLTPGTNVKAYDGTTSATNVPSASGLQGSDTVSGTTVVYNTATAGTGKTLSITAYTVNDNNSGNNYTVTANTSTGGTINKANSTISQSGTNFTYNATGQTPTLSISGSTGARTTNYVGTSVSYTSINPPTNAGSYYVSNTVAADSNYNGATNSLAFTISKAGLTLTPGTNVKAYDGTTSATNVPSASGLQGSDTVSGTTVVYNTATAGTGKTLSITAYTVNDNNSGNNYTVTANTSTGGTINKASPNVTFSSSENPSGYKDSVIFTMSLPTDATGNVNFLTNGVLSDTETLNGGSTTTTNGTLPRGTNLITAIYSGDSNYLDSTNTLNQVVTNHPPVAGAATYYRSEGTSLKILISTLLTNVTDVDGDPITLTGVGSGSTGATITTNSVWIFYLPGSGAGSNANDSFTYTVSDGYGGSATGNINVDVYSATGSAQMSIPTNGVVNIKFFGVPTFSYVVETSTNLTTWWPLSTNTAGSDGSWQFTDPNATNAQQYYRTAQP